MFVKICSICFSCQGKYNKFAWFTFLYVNKVGGTNIKLYIRPGC